MFHAISFYSDTKCTLAELGNVYTEVAIEVHPSFLCSMLVKLQKHFASSREVWKLFLNNILWFDYNSGNKNGAWKTMPKCIGRDLSCGRGNLRLLLLLLCLLLLPSVNLFRKRKQLTNTLSTGWRSCLASSSLLIRSRTWNCWKWRRTPDRPKQGRALLRCVRVFCAEWGEQVRKHKS